MFDSIFSFTNLPLTLLLAMGRGLASLRPRSWSSSLAWLRGGIAVPGYTS